jgi:hypothetical protein
MRGRVPTGMAKHATVEDELAELAAIVADAEAMGIDPWPEPKPSRPWAKWGIATFLAVMMLSWVSKLLFRLVDVSTSGSP